MDTNSHYQEDISLTVTIPATRTMFSILNQLYGQLRRKNWKLVAFLTNIKRFVLKNLVPIQILKVMISTFL